MQARDYYPLTIDSGTNVSYTYAHTGLTSLTAMASQTAIIVPCYNEEKRLKKAEFLRFLTGPGSKLHAMLFVNDGSTDATLEVLKSLESEMPARIKVVNCEENGGKAEAVRKGLLAAIDLPGIRYVGFWDADLATPLYHILDFIAIAEEKPHLEMIFGARVALLGRQIKRNLNKYEQEFCQQASGTSSALHHTIFNI